MGDEAHIVSDRPGNPLAVVLTGGREQEVIHSDAVLAAVPTGLGPPRALAGDKGYSADRVRAKLTAAGVEDVIARRKDELAWLAVPPAFDEEKYKGRNVIERLNGWLKERRRLATRFDKRAVNFRAMFQLAFVLLYLTH